MLVNSPTGENKETCIIIANSVRGGQTRMNQEEKGEKKGACHHNMGVALTFPCYCDSPLFTPPSSPFSF